MDLVRFVLYSLSILFSAAMAGRLFPLNNRLATAFGVVMLVWAINSGLLLGLLIYYLVSGDPYPSWRDAAMLINAALMAMTVIGLHLIFPDRLRHD
jgi:hypothetical protein